MKHPSKSQGLRHRSRWGVLATSALFALTLAACSGDDGKDGAPGAPGQDADPAITDSLQAQIDAIVKNPETCVTCHTGEGSPARTGPGHQAVYDQFYQDGVVKVSNMAFSVSGTTATLTFQLRKNGAAFDCRKTGDFAIGSYWAEYDVASKSFASNQSLVGTKSWNAATNVCTFTRTVTAEQAAKMAGNGIVQLYGTDEILVRDSAAHLSLGKYPFAGVLKIGTVDYSTAANVTGCENCHTRPFLKHGYIYGTVLDQNNQPTEFYTCKGCHYDQRNGGHQDWQLLGDAKMVEDEALAAQLQARYAEVAAGSPLTDEEKAKYAYKAKLMNDVHMSHAMEFPYPQRMNNCVTCHAGKLTTALDDSKFKRETCSSCHGVERLKEMMSTGNFSHSTIIPNWDTVDCTNCHKAGQSAPRFTDLHNGGYDRTIYSSTGVRYSTALVTNVDSASLDANNKLTISFSATSSIASIPADGMVPTVLVGLYGYDSKDFIVAAHGRDSAGNRLLEWVWGTTHPRFTNAVKGNGTWQVTVDLSDWASRIGAGKEIRRAEIAVMPQFRSGTTTLGVNAPSRTFDLTKNQFDDTFFTDIVKVAGCNTCHDQLATTFHSGNRGGNVKVCRICHEVSSAGSHLELQSRSIDSYVHAIHSFQVFDPADINFGDPFESVEYEHHVNTYFPRFGILDCESCHGAGNTPNVPDQARSMPGVLSATDEVEGRTIGPIPRTVTGPAVRACGACHRAQAINADDSGQLAILTAHFKQNGYSIEETADTSARTIWEELVAKIMALFPYRR